MAVTLWAIWYARRQAIHENSFQSPFATHCFINRFLGDLEGSQNRSPRPTVIKEGRPQWIAPPVGVAKINVDAAVSKSSNIEATAAVARDDNGNFLGASAVVWEGFEDPEILEAMACREGLSLAADLCLGKIRIASDCLNVVRAIGDVGMGRAGHIIREIKATMSELQTAEVVHEGRASNGDAHSVARSAIYDPPGRRVWLLSPPEGVCNSYAPDV